MEPKFIAGDLPASIRSLHFTIAGVPVVVVNQDPAPEGDADPQLRRFPGADGDRLEGEG